MRALPALAALLLLVLPGALAQAPLSQGSVTIRAEPPADPIDPTGPGLAVPLRVVALCDATDAAGQLTLTLRIARIPPWADVRVEPALQDADGSPCAWARQVAFNATAYVRASEQAPAFTPDEVRLDAQVDAPLRPSATGAVAFPVAAGFLSSISGSLGTSSLELAPGGTGVVPVRLANFGNANTRVAFSVETHATDLVVPLPNPVILQSRQAGAAHNEADLPLTVHRVAGSVATLGETVTLRWTSSYALDARLPGDAGALTFLVNPTLDEPATPLRKAESRAPAGGVALAALGLVGAARLLRRR